MRKLLIMAVALVVCEIAFAQQIPYSNCTNGFQGTYNAGPIVWLDDASVASTNSKSAPGTNVVTIVGYGTNSGSFFVGSNLVVNGSITSANFMATNNASSFIGNIQVISLTNAITKTYITNTIGKTLTFVILPNVVYNGGVTTANVNTVEWQ